MKLQSTIRGVDLLATTEITVFFGGDLILGMFIPSNVEFEAATLLFRGRQKRRIYFLCFLPLGGDGFLG